MPLNQYDRYFGGKPGAAAKAAHALEKEYGPEQGRGYFYAIVAKRKKAARK